MSFTELERQTLGSIADGLAGSDPRLASMLTIFSRLAADEEMPVREKIRVRRGRPAAQRPRRARRHPRRGTAFPQPRRLYTRLGWQQAMLLLGAVISAALLTAALALNASGPKTWVRSMGTACPSPSGRCLTGRPCRCVSRPGLVGRWGPADRPCGICGLLSFWPLGRCRTGRVIPSVGGVPELPALPIEGTRDDRGREPE